jgi:hypothetical protein
VVEVHAQPRFSHPLDHLGETPEQPVVADALVVERREHQHAATPQLHGVRGEPDRVGQRAVTGARHHPGGVDARADQPVEQLDLLVDRQRVGLRVGAEHGQADILRQQPAALAHEPLGVGRQIGLEGRDDGRQNAGDALGIVHAGDDTLLGSGVASDGPDDALPCRP